MKKIIWNKWFCLILCLFVTVLSGCSNKKEISENNLSIEKKKKLKIYSLYDDRNLNQIINYFSRNNLEYDIDHEIGISEEKAITPTKAIKTLNSEILTGDGPDIIIMDGLNIDKYIEQELLVDINDIVSNNNDLFKEISESYSIGGKTYAIPTRFNYMSFIQDGQTVNYSDDLDKIISEIKAAKKNNEESKFFRANMYNMAAIAYRVAIGDKLTNSEKISEEDIKKFYNILLSIYDIVEESEEDPEGNGRKLGDIVLNNIYFGSIMEMAENKYSYSFDYIDSAPTIRELILAKKEGFSTSEIAIDSNKIYIPTVILSINNKSKNTYGAKEFIKTVLTEEAQSEDQYYGISINKKAVENALREKSEMTITIKSDNGNRKTVPFDNLSEEEINNTLKDLNELSRLNKTDLIIMKLVLENGQKIIDKKIDDNDAAKEVMKKIKLYQAE